MKKKWISLIPLLIAIVLAYFFYQRSLTQATYEGLPTVPCIDYTKPIVEDYSFKLSVTILDKNYPVPSRLGHDYGQCLHDIYANDSSGKIYVKTNEEQSFDLGNLFDVWHSTFNNGQIFGYQTTNGHKIEVFLNGKQIETGRQTRLLPESEIKIVYK